MSDYNKILQKVIGNPSSFDESDVAALRRACREYPADVIAPALLLKYADGWLDENERKAARARVALYSGDAAAVIRFIDPSGKGFDSFYPPLPDTDRPSTSGAIDLFLETYGRQSPEEEALLERMIFNPVPDYAEQLAREESEEPAKEADSQDTLIDSFLASHRPEPKGEDTPAAPALPVEGRPSNAEPGLTRESRQGPSLLSESLAKIFIKQGRYERAFEIISNLSLNYPEKSIYFADQLRFLEKLIINLKYSKND